MKTTIAVFSVACLVLSTVAQADETSQGSDASVSSSTIVSGPVQASASASDLLSTAGGTVDGVSASTSGLLPLTFASVFGANQIGLGSQFAEGVTIDLLGSFEGAGHGPTETPATPYDNYYPAVNSFALEAALPAEFGLVTVSHAELDDLTATRTVPAPAPLLAMAIGLTGLALKRKRA